MRNYSESDNDFFSCPSYSCCFEAILTTFVATLATALDDTLAATFEATLATTLSATFAGAFKGTLALTLGVSLY